jgi:hypothetical protein
LFGADHGSRLDMQRIHTVPIPAVWRTLEPLKLRAAKL